MKILITGASRGIGLALVEKAIELNYQVIAVSRKSISIQHKNLITISADITTPSGLDHVSSHPDIQQGVDILINNAGVLEKNDLQDINGQTFATSFHLNATTPFLLTQKLLPQLKKSKNPKVIQISTLMSSIQDNSSGGYYSYRSSKAALNMITKSLSIDHPDICFGLIHPGWVKTEMGGATAPIDTKESATGIWNVIHSLQAGKKLELTDYKGKALTW